MHRVIHLLGLVALLGCSSSVTNAAGGTTSSTSTASTTTSTTSTTSTGSGGGGGSGGAGGASSTGGAGGSTIVPVECTDCLATTISWAYEGGLSQTQPTSTLAACRTFTYTQKGTPDRTCSVDIGACDAASNGVRPIEQALAHPDVVAALASPAELYGDDEQCVDRPILVVDVGGAKLRIGYPCPEDGKAACNPQNACAPIPAGVAALEKALLDTQVATMELGDCAKVFH